MKMSDALTTKRLRLKVFDPSDVPELHEILSDPDTNTVGQGPFASIAETVAWVLRRQELYGSFGIAWYGLREQTTGDLIGNCGVLPGRTGVNEPEIGYLVRRQSRGCGYAMEAAEAVIEACRLAGLSRVWATIRPANVPSCRIAERLGMHVDHTEFDSLGELLFYVRDA
jgi:ribosomal-protein-alanine N-acetyltransferase